MRALPLGCLLTLLVAAPAAAKPHFFRLAVAAPMEISCVLDTTIARCDVRNPGWTVGDKPSSCRHDWGHAVAVKPRSRRGGFLCASDTVLGATKVLRPGGSIKEGRMRCTARREWMTCTNGRRHGFRVGPGTRDFF